MKVLLILTNSQFWYAVKRSFVIWLSTGMMGASVVCGLQAMPPNPYSVFLSLMFSGPALVMAIPVLYYLPAIHDRKMRVTIAILSVLAVSFIVFGITSIFLRLRLEEVSFILFPFVPSAVLCLFLFAGKQITKGDRK